MARHKKFIQFKLPFLKKLKIQKNTFANIIGLLVFGSSCITLLSFMQTGDVLILIHTWLQGHFGILSILFPIVLLLFASHFFSSKKLSIIKPHVTVGLLLIFVALLGFFTAGKIGFIISDNLTADFSGIGSFLILFITLVVGIILFFNTSIDAFLLMIIEFIKKMVVLVSGNLIGGLAAKNKNVKGVAPGKGEFITGGAQAPVLTTQQPLPAPKSDGQISIRPLTSEAAKNWAYPPLTLLRDVAKQEADAGDVAANADTIEKTLDSFGIQARVSEINKGPTVTQYALEIVRGTKLSKITGLANDLALALAAPTGQVRIEAPIPGRAMVGIEIPNRRSEIVPLKKMLSSEIMTSNQHPLVVPLGLDVSGKPQVVNITQMPHALIAGTTGSGKSVLLNAWICSILFRSTPQDIRLILVDPKRVELTQYNGIPHLLTEVIVEPDKIISALKWTVGEMENRYKIFAKANARNIESYNSQLKDPNEKVPYILFVIDELADLMIYAPGEAEENITRIAQMARATGIHLILATQRPSVDVITGLMKANIPARVAFNVASLIDSRVVLDTPGAEKLVGRGDMLFLPPEQAKPRRIQGPFLEEKDVTSIVDFLRKKSPVVQYTEEVTEQDVTIKSSGGRTTSPDGGDPLYKQAIDLIYQEGKASASHLQRRLSVGYARAARILDQLEGAGIVGPGKGSKPREILSRPQVPTNSEEIS